MLTIPNVSSGYRKAIVVGIVFFIIGLLGAHLLFSWEQWRLSHPRVIYPGPYPVSSPFESSEIFTAILLSMAAGLILLPVLAGAVTTVLLPAWRAARKDAFKSAGLAGAVTLVLISITFWALLVPDMVRTLNAGITIDPFPYLLGLIADLLIILFGGLLAAVTGAIVQALAGVIARAIRKAH
ncbi:MAG: hypothetical protein WBZ29_06785 [Methanocella sp.]